MRPLKINWKLLVSLGLGALFIFLAFRQVDLRQMGRAFATADYVWLLPSLLLIFLGFYLRTLRWKYLLEPVRPVKLGVLFSALMVGYMANTVLPAHLGELARAYLVGKKESLRASAVFASIVIERIIDVFTLLAFMALAMIIFPSFPPWVRQSGFITLAVMLALLAVLLLMKRFRTQSLRLLEKLTTALPRRLRERLNSMLHSFLDGVTPLKNRWRYLQVTLLSVLIWICYGLVFQLNFYSFGFQRDYVLPWSAALVLLVITTISVVVPSSPGYIGTYHYLCQLSLAFFGIPKGPALTYAFVLHAINIFPPFILGLFFFYRERLSFKTIRAADPAKP